MTEENRTNGSCFSESMNNDRPARRELPVIGLSGITLGGHYDAREERLVTSMSSWNPQQLQENIDEQTYFTETANFFASHSLSEKTKTLNLSAGAKASFLCNLLEVNGLAEFISKESNSEENIRYYLHYSCITGNKKLTMKHLAAENIQYREELKNSQATHIIAQIDYGIDICLAFDRPIKKNNETPFSADFSGSLRVCDLDGIIRKILKMSLDVAENLLTGATNNPVKEDGGHGVQGKFEWSNKNNEELENIACFAYSDCKLSVRPTNLREALDFYRNIRSHTEGAQPVPKRIYLLPLQELDNLINPPAFRSLGIPIVDSMEKVMQNIGLARHELNSIRLNAAELPSVQKDIRELISLLDKQENNLKYCCADLLKKIRACQKHESEIQQVLNLFESSPFGSAGLSLFIDSLLKLLKQQKHVQECLKGSKASLVQENQIRIAYNNRIPTLFFVWHIATLHDGFINQARSFCLTKSFVTKQPNISFQWTPTCLDGYFADRMDADIRIFGDYVNQNNENSDIHFCCVFDGPPPPNECANNVRFLLIDSDGIKSDCFELPLSLGQPTIDSTATTSHSILLKWKMTEKKFDEYISFFILRKDGNVEDWLTLAEVTDGSHREYTVDGLLPDTVYEFRVQIQVTNVGLSIPSRATLKEKTKNAPIQVKSAYEQSLLDRAKRLKEASELVVDPDPKSELPVFRLKRTQHKHGEEVNFFEIGQPKEGEISEKVILFVGGSGSGKTTMINSMVNYLYEVDKSFDFRLKLDVENEADAWDETKSHTRTVNSYTIRDTRLNYSLTMVDTPGFGSPEGVEFDQKTVESIKKWFESNKERNILNAICIVVKSTENRSNVQVEQELHSFIELFGKDVIDNIVVLFTFCDSSIPLAIEALKKNHIPCGKTFKFNNSAIYQRALMMACTPGNDLHAKEAKAQEPSWTLTMTSFEQFFELLEHLSVGQFQDTCEIFQQRERLETFVGSLVDQIRELVEHAMKTDKNIEILEQNQEKLRTDPEAKLLVNVERKIMEEVKDFALECMKCNVTCHYPCKIKNVSHMHWCSAMAEVIPPTKDQFITHQAGLFFWKFLNQVKRHGPDENRIGKSTYYQVSQQQKFSQKEYAVCKVCKNKCSYKDHQCRVKRKIIVSFEEKLMTVREWKEKLDDNFAQSAMCMQSAVDSDANLLLQLTEEFVDKSKQIAKKVRDVSNQLTKLSELSIQPKQYTEVAYLRMMIINEQRKGPHASAQKLQLLDRHLETFELLERLQNTSKITLVEETEKSSMAYLAATKETLGAMIKNDATGASTQNYGLQALRERIRNITESLRYPTRNNRAAVFDVGGEFSNSGRHQATSPEVGRDAVAMTDQELEELRRTPSTRSEVHKPKSKFELI